MPNGVKLDRAARRVFREAAEVGSITDSVFSEPGAERFVAYLKEGDSGGRANGGVNRYARALWDSRRIFARSSRASPGERRRLRQLAAHDGR